MRLPPALPAICLATLALAVGPGCLPTASARDDEPTPVTLESVDDAIEGGVAWLLDDQRRSGTWGTGDSALGQTALAVFTLLHCGLREDQTGRPAKQLRKAMRHLDRTGPGREGRRADDPGTYTTSLLLLLLRDRGRPHDRARMQALADLLVRTQAENGQWWYYGRPGRTGKRGPDTGDNSNTQFALLALGAAHGFGIDVPRETFERARAWWHSSVHTRGGFGYASGGSPKSQPTSSMTAAGIACLAVCDAALDGAVGAGDAMSSAQRWMEEHYSVTKNEGPAKGRAGQRQRAAGRGWLHYYLWTLERAMVLSGRETVGAHDWYREGAAQLLDTQYDDGSWRGERPLYATCFALLFLTRAADPPRAFTRPRDAPSDAAPAGPVTGDREPEADEPEAAAPDAERAPPTGTLEDWLEETLPPGELAGRCRSLGADVLRPLVAFLADPDREKRQRAHEALSLLLPEPRLHRVDRHPLARGRLELWLRKNEAVLVLDDGRFVLP